MKKTLLFLILFSSVAFAQNEKINIYTKSSTAPTSFSIIGVPFIYFANEYMFVRTGLENQPFSLDDLDIITFSPPALDIEVYFIRKGKEMLTYRTGEFDTLRFVTETESVENNGESSPGEVSFTKGCPNPFSSEILIEFALEKPGNVEVTVADINGRQLRTLLSGSLTPGTQSVAWDALDDSGNRVGTGSYICSVKLNNTIVSKKLLFVK